VVGRPAGEQGEGVFPSAQRYYRRFLLFIIRLTATCLGRTTTLLTTDPLFLGY
jgi:hypothetical protein